MTRSPASCRRRMPSSRATVRGWRRSRSSSACHSSCAAELRRPLTVFDVIRAAPGHRRAGPTDGACAGAAATRVMKGGVMRLSTCRSRSDARRSGASVRLPERRLTGEGARASLPEGVARPEGLALHQGGDDVLDRRHQQPVGVGFDRCSVGTIARDSSASTQRRPRSSQPLLRTPRRRTSRTPTASSGRRTTTATSCARSTSDGAVKRHGAASDRIRRRRGLSPRPGRSGSPSITAVRSRESIRRPVTWLQR